MCDTFVALPSSTADGSIIFAKNSDREANEAQQLEYHEAKSFRSGAEVRCTYIDIPQVAKTNAVLLSRPFWMWGAEMGANEHGVVIGNEAVFTRLKVKKDGVLTGMDLLRLALERADSARKAKDFIIGMLEKYGQGGVAGYRDKSFVYHNSFIITDKDEAWVLETAGEFWASKKVENYYAISNGLTIEDDYDQIHPEAEAFARRKGWSLPSFGFASSFSDKLYTRFSDCQLRRSQAEGYLKHHRVNLQSAFKHLRSHYRQPYNPAGHFLSNSICAHAGNWLTRHASQTTGSMVAHLTKESPTFWVTATSAPCLSVFKPVWFNHRVLADLGPVLKAEADKNSFWWLFETLHREVLKDYRHRAGLVQKEQEILESSLLKLVYDEGENDFEVTQEAFIRAQSLVADLLDKIKSLPLKRSMNLFYNKYWNKLNQQAQI
jgi:secernin